MLRKPSFHVRDKPVGFLVVAGEVAAMFEGIDRPMYQPSK
jgi:hypothetical protein